MHLVSPPGSSRGYQLLFYRGGRCAGRLTGWGTAPTQMQRKGERHLVPTSTSAPRKVAGEGDTGVAALLGSGRSVGPPPPTRSRPGEGLSLADKGVREKVRNATPEGWGAHPASRRRGGSLRPPGPAARLLPWLCRRPRPREAPGARGPPRAGRAPSGLRLPPTWDPGGAARLRPGNGPRRPCPACGA